MPKNEISSLLDSFCQENRCDIERLFHIDELSSEQVKQCMESKLRQMGLDHHISMDQWKRQLGKLKIRKNLCQREVDAIESHLGPSPEIMPYLILADGILLDGNRVREYRQKKNQDSRFHRNEHPRQIAYVQVPSTCTLTSLSDPFIFKYFRQLLFYTRVHFDRSFYLRIWTIDRRGLYARTSALRSDLTQLSKLHNKISDALGQFRAENMSTAWALIRSAFLSIKEAVVNLHHRQLPDLLAILLMLQRNKHTDPIHESMTRYLHLTARKYLFQDSPVRAVFESLPGLPKDPAGHLFLAYDAYCRAIWKHNTGDGGIKALWSFNQASFPRAEEGGFYEILKGMQPEDIEIQLRLVEEDWGPCSTETFSLWHMVAQWFYRNGEFRYMESFLQQLCARVHGLENEFNYAEDHQLNFNCMMSFSLLGVAQESQGDLISAMVALHRSIAIRSQIIPNGMWDPGKLAALRKLRSIVQRLGDAAQASYCTEQIDSMYASQEREDRQEQQLSGARRN